MSEYVDIYSLFSDMSKIKEDRTLFENITYPTPKELLPKDVSYDEYTWEESLEEQLDYIKLNEDVKEYYRGQIIMPKRFTTERGEVIESPHRLMIIRKAYTMGEQKNFTYKGFMLSSKIDKANKFNYSYPNNIYIDSYNSILDNAKIRDDKPCIIRVDEFISCTDDDLDEYSTLKGTTSKEFQDFINDCRCNFEMNNNANRDITWENHS